MQTRPDDNFFLERLWSDGNACQALTAARAIRNHALHKKRQLSSPLPDEELLPTTPTLIQALVTTDDIIERLLTCRCDLCASHTQRQDAAIIRQHFVDSQDGLATIGALALAGCTFAIPMLYDQRFDLELFTRTIADSLPLRVRLFPNLNDEQRRQRSNDFVEAVGLKIWIFRIPILSTQHASGLGEYVRKQNFPFVEEESMARSPRPGTSLTKCEIAAGYCREPGALSTPTQSLFRKSIACAIPPPGSKSKAEREAEILLQLRASGHANIINIIFAFIEHTSPDRCIVHMVFPFKQFNLQEYLYHRRIEEISRLYDEAQGSPEPILSHGLWLASIDLVKAVRDIHGLRHEGDREALGAQNVNDSLFSGVHSDIKPENIVIDIDRGKLLLADFGNAELRHGLSDDAHDPDSPATSYNYAAPESDHDTSFAGGRKPRFAYDVWSLACVLLEILVCLAQRTPTPSGLLSSRDRAVQRFRERRESESHEDFKNAAFWKIEGGRVVLRKVVQDYLQEFENYGGSALKQVVNTIRHMLAVDPNQRPSITECLKEMTGIGAASHRIFLTGYSQLMASARLRQQLSAMSTFFSTTQMPSPMECDIELWRNDRDRYSINMVLTSAGVPWNKDTNYKQDSLVPTSFFENGQVPEQNAGSSATIDCHFVHLHQGITLHFRSPEDFCVFFTLMTHQRMQPVKNATNPEHLVRSRHNMRITKCELVRKDNAIGNLFRRADDRREYYHGRVQVWKSLSKEDYDEMYLGIKSPIQQTSGESRFKLVIFAQTQFCSAPTSQDGSSASSTKQSVSSGESKRSKKKTNNTSEILVMQLDRSNVQLVPLSNDAVIRLKNKRSGGERKKMPVAVLTVPQEQNGTIHVSEYPGIPLDPDAVTRSLLKGKDVDEICLYFSSLKERDQLIDVFRICDYPEGIRNVPRRERSNGVSPISQRHRVNSSY